MEQYLIYLRKSRKDRDLELQTGNCDTLQRHRETLMSLARQRGYFISGIFEEVVSGDTIAERPEMQKLLAAVETGAYAGVLVMEVPRLARGNTRDQGVVAETFQYSGTKIITPDKTYDPSDEADEEYFEFGLFMSRREYKAINRRLQRGRMASLQEGKYIAGTAPYGYRKVRLQHQKGYTLDIVPEQADVVREIFHLYTSPAPDGGQPVGSYGIANLLNERGVPSPGGTRWSASAVRNILKNPVYAGYVRWSYRPDKKQMQDGNKVVSRPVNRDAILQKGIHEAIVTEAVWKAAEADMSRRSHAPVPGRKRVANPLAGLVYCDMCGRSMVQLPQGDHGVPMLMCPTPKCPARGSRRDVVEDALMSALREWMQDHSIDTASAQDAEALVQKENIERAERALANSKKALETLQQQKGSLYDLLEQGIYTQDVFLERTRVLAARMQDTEKQFREASEHLTALQEEEMMRDSLLPRIQNVLDVYGSLETPAEKNALLKSALDHVVYVKTTGGRYQESDMRLYVFPRVAAQDSHL